ncbi:hypothetical protein [Algoriphagus ratkowskyi]|uniref:hypothetical protein n=1 Tax=Algoriphagus ratkowskyi TaxID=57028 RepID=UPI00130297A1|nr:hypothetical protein [Algoriphagus ratkowskyi]
MFRFIEGRGSILRNKKFFNCDIRIWDSERIIFSTWNKNKNGNSMLIQEIRNIPDIGS